VFVISLWLFLESLLTPCLMFASKASILAECFTRVGSYHSRKHYHRVEKLAMDDHLLITNIHKLRP